MPSSVFISHSSKDQATADAICKHLESAGIKCWIAPRDIEVGSDWTKGIMRGLAGCRRARNALTQNTCTKKSRPTYSELVSAKRS
jgi:hypothetical protein